MGGHIRDFFFLKKNPYTSGHIILSSTPSKSTHHLPTSWKTNEIHPSLLVFQHKTTQNNTNYIIVSHPTTTKATPRRRYITTTSEIAEPNLAFLSFLSFPQYAKQNNKTKDNSITAHSFPLLFHSTRLDSNLLDKKPSHHSSDIAQPASHLRPRPSLILLTVYKLSFLWPP